MYNKNSKAFTLVEMIAVLVVLVAIFLVCFPNLLNITKVKKDKKYDNMVNDLCLAGESYIYSNSNQYNSFFESNNDIELKIKDLMVYGSVKKSLKNPNTKKSVENDILIYKISDNRILDCFYEER